MLLNSEDLKFQLYEVLEVEQLCSRQRFAEHSRETFDAIIETSRQLAEKYFAPHNAVADAHEPEFDGEQVTILPEVQEAIGHFAEAGLIAACFDEAYGGMQLPAVVNAACQAYFLAANPSTVAYPFLAGAAANVIAEFGTDEQKARYLEAMLSGRFSGTMALTEPGVGSSLGDLTTSARRAGDGRYHIKGQKMFISGGDHQMTENIIHLVLARVEGDPIGVKGISLFIVPKFIVGDDGACGERNDVVLAGLLHKMGYRGTTSTVLNFGENDDCVGYLLGEEGRGLQYMFKMMNEARIGVGLGASMIAYRGYMDSLEYARERPQGRLPSNRDPASAPVKLVEHADVRRMLLEQKAIVEGGLSLCLYAASLVDELATSDDKKQKAAVAAELDLLTPVVKAWPSKYGPHANDLAIQILGGAGYTRDYPLEQYYRDNRLNPIHEGTNGIQALDLLGRKLWQANGMGLGILQQKITTTITSASQVEELHDLAAGLKSAVEELGKITLFLGGSLKSGGPDLTLANASVYLDVFSRVVIAWRWLEQAVCACRTQQNGFSEELIRGKKQAAQYYFRWELPKNSSQIRLLNSLDTTCFEMRDEWF